MKETCESLFGDFLYQCWPWPTTVGVMRAIDQRRGMNRRITHPLEGDGAVILDACHAGVESVVQMDDDGGTKTNARGGECYRTCFVLQGANYEPPKEHA